MLLLTKAIFAIMIGFLSSTILGLFLIPVLRKLRIGQKISIFVGDSHRKKEGTPTMGGLIFIVPTILAILFLLITDKVTYTSNIGIVKYEDGILKLHTNLRVPVLTNFDFIQKQCEELKSPVILGVSEGAGKYMTGYKTVADMVKAMIDYLGITVPVA